jgi:hypothetical protein
MGNAWKYLATVSFISACSLNIAPKIDHTAASETPKPTATHDARQNSQAAVSPTPTPRSTKTPTPHETASPTPTPGSSKSPTPPPATPIPEPTATPRASWVKVDAGLYRFSHEPLGIDPYAPHNNIYPVVDNIGLNNGRLAIEVWGFKYSDMSEVYPKCFENTWQYPCTTVYGTWIEDENDVFQFARQFTLPYEGKHWSGGRFGSGGYPSYYYPSLYIQKVGSERASEGVREYLDEVDTVTRIAKLTHVANPKSFFVPPIVPLAQLPGLLAYFSLGLTKAVYATGAPDVYIAPYAGDEAIVRAYHPRLKGKTVRAAVYVERKQRLYVLLDKYDQFAEFDQQALLYMEMN